VLACGNPSRGDDALGPLLIERLVKLQRAGRLGQVDLLNDFQLQVEHALDLQGRELVLFVDAAVSGPEPFNLGPVGPAPEIGYTTHAMTPDAVLRVFEQVTDQDAPPARLLAIRGYRFELGRPLTRPARENLDEAVGFLLRLLADPRLSTPG
jgi:hydrogenase maturation protease